MIKSHFAQVFIEGNHYDKKTHLQNDKCNLFNFEWMTWHFFLWWLEFQNSCHWWQIFYLFLISLQSWSMSKHFWRLTGLSSQPKTWLISYCVDTIGSSAYPTYNIKGRHAMHSLYWSGWLMTCGKFRRITLHLFFTCRCIFAVASIMTVM